MKTAKIKRMVGIALMSAIVVVMQLVGSFIRFGPVSVSLVLIPIVVGAAMYGPSAGAVLGGVFGIVVLTQPDTAAFFGISVIGTVITVMGKGILAGMACGFVYKLLSGLNRYVAMLCAAIVCPFVNTGVFIACMMTFFMDVLTAWADGGEIVAYVLSGLVLCNFVPELIINVIFSPASARIAQTVSKGM